MSYTSKSLKTGEQIQIQTSVSSWALVLPCIAGVVLAPVSFGFSLLIPAISWVDRYFTEYSVTSAGALVKRGIIRRRVGRILKTKVESVNLRQSILGRILGYGDVTVAGTGGNVLRFRMVQDPIGFMNLIQQ
jgi:uncharacterized membrane protein YdbT with pleckstrin-like domain